MTLRPASDRSLLVSFGDEISPEAHRHVVRLTGGLAGAPGILNLHPAFASLLVDFDPLLCRHADVATLVRQRLAGPPEIAATQPRSVTIPVHFGGDAGPDLDAVSRHTGLAPERVIERFCAARFEVAFVGFATCFPYLAGLPPELATPRLPAPRKLVPAGSVAIAGPQAGVYPLASPGGWRIVGRTAMPLFRRHGEPPSLLQMSDRVVFVPERPR